MYYLVNELEEKNRTVGLIFKKINGLAIKSSHLQLIIPVTLFIKLKQRSPQARTHVCQTVKTPT